MTDAIDMVLIQYVKNTPELYGSGPRKKLKRSKRQKIWEGIGKKLDLDTELCKKRWKSLRDQYVRLRKKGNEHLIYMDGSLRFLDGVLGCKNKSKKSNSLERTQMNKNNNKSQINDISGSEDAVKGDNVTYITQDMIQRLLDGSKVNNDISEIPADPLVALVKCKLEQTLNKNLPTVHNNKETINLNNRNLAREHNNIETIDLDSEIEVANDSLEKTSGLTSKLIKSTPDSFPHLVHKGSCGSLNVANEKNQNINNKTPSNFENVQSSKGSSILESIISAKTDWPPIHKRKRSLEITDNDAQCKTKLATRKTNATFIEDNATFFSKMAERLDQLPLDMQTEIRFKISSMILNAELKFSSTDKT